MARHGVIRLSMCGPAVPNGGLIMARGGRKDLMVVSFCRAKRSLLWEGVGI